MLQRADASFSGEVVDENGQALPGIHVRGHGCGMSARAVTGEAGRFQLDGLVPDEPLTLWACGVDYGPIHVPKVALSDSPKTIQFAGQATRSLHLKVHDETGRPLAGILARLLGDQCDRSISAGRVSSIEVGGCPPGPLFVEVSRQRPRASLSVWEVSEETRHLDVYFPTAEEQKSIRQERKDRRSRLQPINSRVRFAEHAWLQNPVNIGPLPVRDGVWMLRGIKMASLNFTIPETGDYRITVRTRRVARDTVPQMELKVGRSSAVVSLPSHEWEEHSRSLKLRRGKRTLKVQLQTGWAADLEWVEVRREP